MTKAEEGGPLSIFVIQTSSLICHSSFGFRHSDPLRAEVGVQFFWQTD